MAREAKPGGKKPSGIGGAVKTMLAVIGGIFVLLFAIGIVAVLLEQPRPAENATTPPGGGNVTPANVTLPNKTVVPPATYAYNITVLGYVPTNYMGSPSIGFYALSENGTTGKLVQNATANADGFFSAVLRLEKKAPVLIEAKGIGRKPFLLSAILPADAKPYESIPGLTLAVISPLTNMAAKRAMASAAAGVPLAQAINSAYIGVAQQYGLPDVLTTPPPDPENTEQTEGSTLEQRNYGIVLAGILQEAETLKVRPADLSDALADDASDGTLDGKKQGFAIRIPTIAGSTITMPPAAGTADLQTAINAVIASPSTKANVPKVSIPLHAVPIGLNLAGLMYTTTRVLPAWVSGQSGSAQLEAAGGTHPYRWAVKSGSSLPQWLSLSRGGVLSGTAPSPAGTTMTITPPFTVTVADSEGSTVELELRVTIVSPPPAVEAFSISCFVNKPCSAQAAAAAGGTPPYRFQAHPVFGGTYPLWSSLDAHTAVLTGTPAEKGEYSLQVCAIDSSGGQGCATVAVSVTKAPSLSMDVRGKITDKATGKLVSGAKVSVPYIGAGGAAAQITAYSTDSAMDKDGNNYAMLLPGGLPDNVIVSVDAGEKYLPASTNLKVDYYLEQEGYSYMIVNFELENRSGKTVLVDSTLHHLGDNSYSGAMNSQFQKSAEGITYTHQFTVAASQLAYPTATLWITSRGAENSNTITINGRDIGTLCCSPGDGSFGGLYWTLPQGTLIEGQNTMTISSALTGQSAGDRDDFEFTDITIKLS